MEQLLALWLPILVATVVVFFGGMLCWAVLPHHKPDMGRVPAQPELLEHLKSSGLAPGNYMFPQPEDPKDWSTQEAKDMYAAGPWGVLCLFPAQPSMVKNLLGTLSVVFTITAFVGYLTGLALEGEPDPSFMRVFQIAGTAAVLGHCFGGMTGDVWFGKPVRFVVTDFIDKLVFGIVTGLLFAALWPAPAA